MIGIKNGFHRSVPLLALITLLLSACAGSPSKLNEQHAPTITPPPSFTPTAFAAHIDDLPRSGAEYTLSIWKAECRGAKRSRRY